VSAAIGRVVDEAGEPVAGAFVSVAWSNVPYPEIALLTDAEGKVQMPLPKGQFRIVAHAADGRRGSIETTVSEDSTGAEWRLVLSSPE
jgi:hypothetical protein